ncbi:hypothetical protein HF925_07735 [Acidithiobacillus ferriphilus]|nr:hypothetical protein [Acidithiobacillus ferriphilus]MBU2848470.1 hypothetical protein [Acidithiobacillus ferriphilus]
MNLSRTTVRNYVDYDGDVPKYPNRKERLKPQLGAFVSIRLLFIREHLDQPRQQKRKHSHRIGEPVNVRHDCDSLLRLQVRESKFGIVPHRSSGKALEIWGELIEHSYPLVLLERCIKGRDEDKHIVHQGKCAAFPTTERLFTALHTCLREAGMRHGRDKSSMRVLDR